MPASRLFMVSWAEGFGDRAAPLIFQRDRYHNAAGNGQAGGHLTSTVPVFSRYAGGTRGRRREETRHIAQARRKQNCFSSPSARQTFEGPLLVLAEDGQSGALLARGKRLDGQHGATRPLVLNADPAEQHEVGYREAQLERNSRRISAALSGATRSLEIPGGSA